VNTSFFIKYFLLLIIIALVCGPHSFSDESCNAEDEIISKHVSPKISDQGHIGTCYSYSAAALSEAYFQKKNKKKYEFCPLAMSADYAIDNKEAGGKEKLVIEGGDTCGAVESANKHGYCKKCSKFFEDIINLGGKDGASSKIDERYFNMLNKFFYDYHAYADEYSSGAGAAVAMSVIGDKLEDAQANFASCNSGVALPDVKLPGASVIHRVLKEDHPAEFFRLMLLNTCEPREPKGGYRRYFGGYPECKTTSQFSRLRLKNILQNYFTSGDVLPMGIVFCSRFLLRGGEGYVGINRRSQFAQYDTYWDGYIPQFYDEKTCGMHGAVLIGKRCKAGKPQYLMKNSWGSKCDKYAKTVNCVEGTGTVWVSEDDLLSNIYSYQLME